MAAAGITQFISRVDLASLVLRKKLIPKNSTPVVVEGKDIATVVFEGGTRAELTWKLENMLREVLSPKRQTHDEALHLAEVRASKSVNAEELELMASMFANHKEVLRRIAANPHVNERTQRFLMMDRVCKADVIIQRRLANNPKIVPHILAAVYQQNGDRYVRHLAALNAMTQSKMMDLVNSPVERLCREIARDPDSMTATVAIEGICDPEELRLLAGNSDIILGSERLTAVARNKHTPDDVLESLAEKGEFPLGDMLAGAVDVSASARTTLAWKKDRRRELAEQEQSPGYPGM